MSIDHETNAIATRLAHRSGEAARYWRELDRRVRHSTEGNDPYAPSLRSAAVYRVMEKPCAPRARIIPMLSHHKGCCQPLTRLEKGERR